MGKKLWTNVDGINKKCNTAWINVSGIWKKTNKIFEKQSGQWLERFSGGVSYGTIVAWDGLIADIPDEWALCDGNNGTPNLLDTFIMGGDTVGEIGGSNTHVHTLTNISHTHTMPSGGSHYHLAGAEVPDQKCSTWYTPPKRTSTSGSHTHGDLTSKSHNHSGLTNTSNEPEYYTLLFIMKL